MDSGFQTGWDFVLRIAFSLIPEVHRVDKSQFTYGLKTPNVTVRCV